MSINANAHKTSLEPGDTPQSTPGPSPTNDFVNARALEILREWLSEPGIAEALGQAAADDIMEQAERVRAADAARGP